MKSKPQAPTPKLQGNSKVQTSGAPGTGVPSGLNETASPGGGKTAAEMVRKSNLWRDNYNPLRALTIARLIAIFEAAERGAYVELQLTLRKAEKRYPVLKALKARRLSALQKLDWTIKVTEKLPPGATPQMAEAQQKFLQERYNLVTNLKEAVGQIALSEFRGYAILQKHRYEGGPNAGNVRQFYWLEPWCFSRDGFYGDFYYNPESRIGVGLGSCASILGEMNRIGGDALPREDFIIRESESPLYEIALVAFVNWLMGRKDFSAFVEIFGLPNAVVIMPPNITPGKEMDYQASAEKVADGVSGALPNGSDVKFPAAGTRSEMPFETFCGANDKDVVLAGTGGLLTMLSMPTGIGAGASEQHDDAFDDIAQADALKVVEVLQRDFDQVELAAAFPGQPILAEFQLVTEEEMDVSALCGNVAKLKQAGKNVSTTWLAQQTGYEFAEDDMAPQPGGQPPDSLDDTLVKVSRAGLQPTDKAVPALGKALGFPVERTPEQMQQDRMAMESRRLALEQQGLNQEAIRMQLKSEFPQPTGVGATAGEPATRDGLFSEGVRNRIVRLLNRAGADDAEQLYLAIADDLKPLHDRLAAIEKISDPEIQKRKLAGLLAELDQLAKDMTADPETAHTLEQINARQLGQGAAKETP